MQKSIDFLEKETDTKITKIGSIPKHWVIAQLQDVVSNSVVYGIVQAGPHVDDGIPYITSTDVTRRINIDFLQKTSSEIAHKYRRSEVRPGDIIFSLRGNVGDTCVVPSELKKANLTQGTARIRIKSNSDSQFVNSLFDSDQLKKQIYAVSKGSTFKEISLEELRKLKIPLPPLPEQRAIAAVLGTWDRGIDMLQRLIAAKQRHKKALMQQLLTGKKRFAEYVKVEGTQMTKFGPYPKDWAYVHLDELAREVSAKNRDGVDLPVLSCTKYRGLVDSLEYFGKQIFSKDTSTYKVVKRGQFAYATNHIEEGSIGYQNLYDSALISPMYTAFSTNKKIDDDFLYRLLKTDLYIHIYQSSTSASVDRRGSLRWKEFSKIRIPLPSLAEQQKISSFFEVLDKELEMFERKLEAMKQQKKGLMQKLLTGKVRVPIAKTEVNSN